MQVSILCKINPWYMVVVDPDKWMSRIGTSMGKMVLWTGLQFADISSVLSSK